MSELFDNYHDNYKAVVQSSIDFSGLPHNFFMRAKADVLRGLITNCFGNKYKPATLDVGCGVGSFHPQLRGMVSRLCGIDVSTASIAQARADNAGVEYQAFDGNTFPQESANFDLAIAICVMHHVEPNEWLDFMQEMRRVVRPGGLVCIIEHNPFNPLTRLAVSRCEFDKDAVLLRARQTRSLMAEVGLENIGSRYFLFLPSAAKFAKRIELALRQVPLGGQYITWGIV
jgi:SAM-dependent methyltransferase